MIILVKSSDIVGNIYLSLSALFGGVAYPISVLPNFLQKFSEILPTKHYLEIFRKDAQNNSIIRRFLSRSIHSYHLINRLNMYKCLCIEFCY